MTLEEADRLTLAAAEDGDLKALKAAMKARASAIALLAGTLPSQKSDTRELAARLASSIRAGETLNRILSAFKLRLVTDAARSALLRTRFSGAPTARSTTSVDCRG